MLTLKRSLKKEKGDSKTDDPFNKMRKASQSDFNIPAESLSFIIGIT